MTEGQKLFEKHNKLRQKMTPPSFFSQTKNLAVSAINFAKNGFELANDEIYQKRKIICRECQFWDDKAFGNTGRCLKCGCSSLKLKMLSSQCPIGKWASGD